MGELIKPITLCIDKDVWDKFKGIVPKTISSLNEALVILIEDKIEEETKT